MKHYNHFATNLAALLCVAGLGLSAAASGERHGPRGAPGDFATRHAEQLGLDATTVSAIQAIVDRSGERDVTLREELDEARRGMFELMHEIGSADEGAVLEQADRIGIIETEIHKNRLRGILQIRALLTPKQREQLLELREQGHSERRRRGSRACRDAGEFCSEAAAGRATLACLQEHWDELSPQCQESFDFSKRRGPPHRGGPGH